MTETDWQYVQIRSWHVVRTHTRALDGWITLCGRSAHGDAVETLPFPAGKSCETCLRLALRRGDPVQVAGDVFVSEDDPAAGQVDPE